MTWDPYADSRTDTSVRDLAFYTGYLKYMDYVEPYNPDRFLRQLGHVQRVPLSPYKPRSANRGKKAMSYNVEYSFMPEFWERWQCHLLSAELRGPKATYSFECSPDYLPWFIAHSHPFLENPDNKVDGGYFVTDQDILEVL